MRGRSQTFDRFAGVNTQDAAYLLDDDEARDARNIVSTPRGAVRKRPGMQAFAAPAAEIRSLFAGHVPDILLAASASIIYKIDAAAVVTSLKTGLSNFPWEWVQAPVSGGQGPFWGMNGVDAPVFYDGAAAATGLWTAAVGSLPNGKYLKFHGNRLWIAGTAANPSRLYFSNLRDPRDWPAANVVDFEPEDGEPITGIGAVGDYLLVFKPSKTWIVYGLDDGANRQISESIGCVAHRTIAEVPSGALFLSRDQGVVSTDGQTVRNASDKVLPTFAAIVPANRSLATAVFTGGHYYIAISTTGGANDLVLDYDIAQGTWWIHTPAVRDWAPWEIGGEPRLYAAIAGATRVDRAFVAGVTQDNGQNYEAYWRGAYHVFGAPHRRKRLREVRFDGKGRIQVSVSRDFGRAAELVADVDFTDPGDVFAGGGLFGGEGTFGGLAEVSEARALNPGVARAFSIVLGNETDDEFEIEAYTCLVSDRRD